MLKRKGQSILEYVIVLTAIVAVIIAGAALFARPGDAGKGQGVGKLMDSAASKITTSTAKIATVGQ
ncbi:MAG: hypothetical protein Q8R31_04050 [Candidatus Omnitrophota bacterium]|nr:hypothetical protein [Candidatus Omnitrophota bacterium]